MDNVQNCDRQFWTLSIVLSFIEREREEESLGGIVRNTTVLEGGVIET
jgi:hypothetical protein